MRGIRHLLNSARDIGDDLIAAQITSLSPDPARHIVMLDKGVNDGVVDGQPVLGAEGLIGQVTSSGNRNSRVVLITDSAHALPCAGQSIGAACHCGRQWFN
jgi:rod shape-determining protein MreC